MLDPLSNNNASDYIKRLGGYLAKIKVQENNPFDSSDTKLFRNIEAETIQLATEGTYGAKYYIVLETFKTILLLLIYFGIDLSQIDNMIKINK